MKEHPDYLKGSGDKGTGIILGPGLDPDGPWGVAIVEAMSEDEVRSIIANDPAVLSALGFRYEIYPMPRAFVRK